MKIPYSGEKVDVRRSAIYSIVINAVQIAAVWALAVMLMVNNTHDIQDIFTFLVAALVSLGAALDIREAIAARRKSEEADALGDMVGQMDELNRALRAQRHDFLNHLQVVYSLIEMEEYKEAGDYIERIYGDMQSVSKALRTDSPAINALLRAKLAACENAGILTEVDTAGSWKDLSMPTWEFCRILSNLIDNAMDALENTANSSLRIMLHEDTHGFAFSVANNGPAIPAETMKRIFEPNVSSHGEGRGMGLYIVRGTLEKYGGEIHVTSDQERTIFSGLVPHRKERNAEEKKDP
ncbi:MAG: Spo0B domain-containing protein [Clostridia bacterium]|nr:Spo0B domain-containing protein [Clostridia bacterium]